MKARWLLVLLLCLTTGAQPYLQNRRGAFRRPVEAGGGGGPPASPLLNQNFEGTGYDNGETWSEDAGGETIDEDYTGVVIDGSQSLRILKTVTGQTYIYNTFTAGSQRWAYVKLRFVQQGTGFRPAVVALWTGGFGVLAEVYWDEAGTLSIVQGAAEDTASTVVSLNTTIHLWVEYQAGSGANGVARLAWSTDGTRPTSGSTHFAEITTGGATASAGLITLGFVQSFGGSGTAEAIFDHVYVDDEQIGNNP